MKVEALRCPACGANLSDENAKFCPFCGSAIVMGDSVKYTYTKVDEARLKEAETKEKIRMRELDFEQKKYNEGKKKEKNVIKLIATGVVLIAIIIIVLSIRGKGKGNDLATFINGSKDKETLVVNKEVTVDAVTLARLVAPASEIVAYKYYYTTAGVYDDSKKLFNKKVPFTTDKAVYLVDGVISAGVDISEIKFDVDNKKKIIDVTIKNPKIMSHEIDNDSFQYFEVKNSILNSSNLADFAELESDIKSNQEQKLNDNKEFWENTKNNVKTTIDSLIKASGLTDEYTINYSWVD